MMICGRNNNSVATFFGKKNNKNKKNAVASSSSSSSSSSSTRSSTDINEQQQEPQQEQQQHQPQQLLLSPLSKMMSKFVVDSARKTHDSIENEEEKKEFLVNLKEAMHNSPEYRSDVTVTVNNEQRISRRRSSIDSQQQDEDDDNSHNKIKMMINRRSSTGVINFLVDTTQSTISFIEKEEEKNEFCKQLRSKFQDAFKSNPVVIESAE